MPLWLCILSHFTLIQEKGLAELGRFNKANSAFQVWIKYQDKVLSYSIELARLLLKVFNTAKDFAMTALSIMFLLNWPTEIKNREPNHSVYILSNILLNEYPFSTFR